MSVSPGIVSFSPSAFVAAYPCFAKVPDAALSFNFSLACLQLGNSYGSQVRDEPTRAALLNLLTAHITALLNGVDGAPPSPTLVGRITSANQGSVSVSTEFQSQDEAAAFYNQTQWGATYWRVTAAFRLGGHYVRSPYKGAGGDFGPQSGLGFMDGWPL